MNWSNKRGPIIKRILGSDFFALAFIIIVATLLLFYLSLLRYENFYTTNWDFGIAEQLLWTGSHGYLLFETADFSTSYATSFLQIHSTYIALLISQLYAYFPTPSFLFLLQALFVSLSVIPLYFIILDKFQERYLVYLTIILYLTSFGLLSAFFYDFHWELFIPLEYLSLFYLISRRRYLLAIIPFLVGISTIEVFPLMVAGVFLYFAYSYYGFSFINPIKWHGDRDWFKLFAFFLASFVFYGFFRFFQFYILPQALNHSITSSISIANTGFLPAGVNEVSLLTSLIYWAVLYASLSFVPFLSRKHFILMLPLFIGFTFIDPNLTSGFGDQYSAISMPILIIGFSQGLSKLRADPEKETILPVLITYFSILIFALLFFNASVVLLNPRPPDGVIGLGMLSLIIPLALFKSYIIKHRAKDGVTPGKSKFTGRKRVFIIFILIVIAFNLTLGPLNTSNFSNSPNPGYWIAYAPNPEFKYASILAEKIPSTSSVLASDNLFPMVANNPNAYSLLWFPFNKKVMPNLPFNKTNLPDFVFVDSSQYFLPNYLAQTINSSTVYGLLGFISYAGYPGNIFLYEKNYGGPPYYYNLSYQTAVYI